MKLSELGLLTPKSYSRLNNLKLPFKILIIGSGFLGTYIAKQAANLGMSVTALRKTMNPQVDIKDINSVEKIILHTNPDHIINSAALTNVDDIEKCPNEAYSVNSYGANNIAKISKKFKIPFLHISTDSVFDGINGMYSEADIPNPINEYGKSKLLGEKLVLETLDTATIVRTNFYGYNNEKKFFFNWLLNELKEKRSITGFHDVIFTPLEITNLSDMILELITLNHHGIIHLASNQTISKYEFAKKVAIEFNFRQEQIVKGNITDAQFFAKRPLNTSLNNSLAKKILKTMPVSIEDSLRILKNRLCL